MPFLSRRSVDPLVTTRHSRKQSDPPQTSRSRARSDATLFRRVSTLFAGRRRPPKESAKPRSQALGHICHTLPRSALPRVSNDSTPPVSLEIRRPSGLGRRASIMGSDDSIADSGSIPREARETENRVPKGYASLPNLLGGTFYLPERPYSYHGLVPVRTTSPFTLPDSLLRVILEFLPTHHLPVVARVSREFCASARYALYHSLDLQPMAESSSEKLYNVLACNKALAALVVSFHAHTWPSLELISPDGCVSSIPSDDVRQAFYNMYNLKSLTICSIETIISYSSPLSFSLTHLTILDTKITQSQFQTIRDWLATQPSLESLSFPHLVEYTNVDPSLIGEWATAADPSQSNGHSPFTALLPALKSLHAPTDIVSALCLTMSNPIQHLKLDVRDTLYTGLRPSAVIGSLDGVREMHIIFAAGVDKRTVEKFLVITGNMLTGKNKLDAMKSLEVEVLWTDYDASETLYGIVTSIISRFGGLETLKLTAPFRPVVPDPINLSLLGPLSPAPSPSWTPTSSAFPWAQSPRGSMIIKEFVACEVEKNYAKTWTKQCPSLSDIQFDFSCSTTGEDEDKDVELCGVWFRRRVASPFP